MAPAMARRGGPRTTSTREARLERQIIALFSVVANIMRNKHNARTRGAGDQSAKANPIAVAKSLDAGKSNGARPLDVGSEAMTEAQDQAVEAANEQMRKMLPQAAGMFDQMAGFQKANLDALAAAGAAAVKGVEFLSGELLALNRQAFEHSLANAKRLLDCKTIHDLAEVQADLAHGDFDQMMAQGARIADMAVHVGNAVAAPLRERAGALAGKIGKPFTA